MSVNITYSHAGVSTDTDGNTRIRFTNTPVQRSAMFEEQGHTNIMFLEMPEPQIKGMAAKYLYEHADFQDAGPARDAITDYLIKRARPIALEMGIMPAPRKRGRPAKIKPDERVEQTAALMQEVAELLAEDA